MDKMWGALYLGKAQGVKFSEVDRPTVSGPNDVIIRMHACGVCGSDLHTLDYDLPKPVILGHECAGEVAEVGSAVKSVSVGDHVVVDPNFHCGTCHNCMLGRTNVCQKLVELGVLANGGFAQYLYAPDRFVIKIPREMDWTTAALAEPLSCVVHGFLKTRFHPGETAIVYGAGPIGLLWVYLFRQAGARKIAAVDIAPKRLEAAGKMGADIVINPLTEDPVARIKKETEGFGVEVSVEAIGKVETVENAVKSLGPGGRAILMGVAKHDAFAKLSPVGIMAREWEIMGTNSQIHSFLDAINILASGNFPTSTFVSHQMPLKEINRALEMNMKGETLKTIIDTT
jgi:threonine dehydrogenase-like Zn-dependent dehydrogenase